MKTGVTLADVARAAGVNHATVSRAFSGAAPVAADTRERITEAARQLGYRPSAAARATRTGRTGFIGMIRCQDHSRSVHVPQFDTSLDAALHEQELCLVRDLIDDVAGDGETPALPPRIVRENAVDGLLINYAFAAPRPIQVVLDRCQIPAVWINRKLPTNCVRPDDEGGARDAAAELIRMGHRRVAYVEFADQATDGREDHYSVLDRRAGYVQAMRDAGLTPHAMCLPAPPRQPRSERAGYFVRSLVQWLTQSPRPTAVLCADVGPELLHAAALLDIRVPEDLSVLAISNQINVFHRVTLDTVIVPSAHMATEAVREVTELIAHGGKVRRAVVLPFLREKAGSLAAYRRS